jgi:hypothetical protein
MKIKHYLIASALVGSLAGTAYAASNVDVGTTGSSQGTVTIHGGTSGSAVIGTPAAAGSTTVNLPVGNGTSGQVLTTDGSGNLSYVGQGSPIDFSWAAGMNLSGLSIPVRLSTNAGTVVNVSCRPETLVGGTATLQVWYAASGTALASGTRIDTTACNANTGATTTQSMGVTTSAVPANSWIGIVIPTNAAWATSAGSGAIKIGFTNP